MLGRQTDIAVCVYLLWKLCNTSRGIFRKNWLSIRTSKKSEMVECTW